MSTDYAANCANGNFEGRTGCRTDGRKLQRNVRMEGNFDGNVKMEGNFDGNVKKWTDKIGRAHV